MKKYTVEFELVTGDREDEEFTEVDILQMVWDALITELLDEYVDFDSIKITNVEEE